MNEFKTPADWLERYEGEDTPWDRGEAHPQLADEVARGGLRPPFDGARALVPGCGRAHDGLVLAQAGWVVTAVDFVEQLAESANERLRPYGGEFVATDALAFEGGPFDMIWEHTFLCALQPEQRPLWAAMVRRNLAPEGCLEGIVFPANKPPENEGPPFGYTPEDALELLGPEFRLERREPLESRLPGREWLELRCSFVRSSPE
jgi:SAM-dependent methyltransferase